MGRNKKAQSPYGVEEWGSGYFGVGPTGHLLIRPFGDERAIDLVAVTRQAAQQGLTPPLLVRFPQILHSQIERLYAAFDQAMQEFEYTGHYRSVYPLKVNPLRPVVESLIAAGRPGAFGLEIGSKGELALALGQRLPRGSWICVNGFKDQEVIGLASAAAGGDPEIVVVVERLREIPLLAEAARRQGRTPLIGLRCRLSSRGSGRWEASGGETSKFGLSPSGILRAVAILRQAGLLESLRVLHFHIGSQVTSVRRIKDAVKEAARIYAKLRAGGVPLNTLNVGGGLGVDYDGSGTPSDSSVNYSLQEYANNVVYMVKEVCNEEEVPLPHLVSESGRALTAHHSLLITNCESRESDAPVDVGPLDPSTTADQQNGDVPPQIAEMEAIAQEITVKNFREYYHDAVVTRAEIATLFDLGYLTLEQRARAEQHFYYICRRALAFAQRMQFASDEFRVLEKAFRAKYVANFSVFRSAPDAWAIGQLFPIVPVHRLHQAPTEKGILVDLTCDSDGVIDSFVDVRDVKEMLELHNDQYGQPYLLAICLLGAYQEIMGDHHNLLGRPAEISVTYESGTGQVALLSRGDTIDDLLELAGYGAQHFYCHAVRRTDSAAARAALQERHTRLRGGTSYLTERPADYQNLGEP